VSKIASCTRLNHCWKDQADALHSGERSQAAYSTRAKIYFYPEADMIELDGAMWRCGREGAKYVIRERL
jgi:hypothetical protein